MRTIFGNLKTGSKFSGIHNGNRDYTKIDEYHYLFEGKKESIDSNFVVHSVQSDDLKNKEIRSKWNTDLDFVSVMKILIFGFVAIWVLSIIFSSHEPSRKPDYLGSAEEKMDKGLPLNNQEQKAVDDALGTKNQSKEIEKKHGQ